MKRGSRGQDLNQHRKGEASDSEMLNLRGCERWGRGSSVAEGAGVDARSWLLPLWLGLEWRELRQH